MKVKLLRIGIAVFLFLSIIGSDLFSTLPVRATVTVHKSVENSPSYTGGTVTSQISASADDSCGNGSYSNSRTAQFMGTNSGQAFSSAFIFRGITIPSTATVTSAYITFTAIDDNTSTAKLLIKGQSNAAPSAYGAGEDYTARSYLSTTVEDDTQTSWTHDNTYNTVDISTIIQALLTANGSYVSGTMAFEIVNNGTTGSYNFQYAYSYDNTPAKAASLTINYTGGSSPTGFYWVGNSGNWSDATHHWATSSGGTPNVANVPTDSDNVYFDANSFAGESGDTVTQDVFQAHCNNMDWTGATGTPIFNMNGNYLEVYGDFILISDMVCSSYGQLDLYSSSTADFTPACSTVNAGGGIWFHSGTYNLRCNLNTGSNNISVSAGATFNSNDYDITVTGDAFNFHFESGSFGNLGSSVITDTRTNNSNPVEFSFLGTMTGTETINTCWCANFNGYYFMTPRVSLYLEGTFYDVNLTPGDYLSWANHVLYIGNGTSTIFHDFSITGAATLGSSDDNNIYELGDVVFNGDLSVEGDNSSSHRIFFGSTPTGTLRQNTANGTVTFTNANVSDILGVGTNPWDLSTTLNSDFGGNSGLTFTPGVTSYWVGNTGNWSDLTHWASTSNGTPSTGRIPLIQDTAIFDQYSFTATTRTVTVDVTNLPTIDTSGVLHSPTFSSGGSWANIYGDLTLGTLTWSVAATIFTGGNDSTLISNSTMTGDVKCDKNSGTMSTLFFGSNIDIVGTFYLDSGTLDLSGYNLTASYFNTTSGYTRHFIAGSSVIQLNGTDAYTKWNVSSYLFTFTCGTSEIILTNSGTNSQTFAGAGLTYYNVVIAGDGDYTMYITNSNIFHVLSIDRSVAHKTIDGNSYTQTIGTFSVPQAAAPNASRTVTLHNLRLSKVSGTVICDYLNFDSGDNTCIASGGAVFYAGAHSTGGPQTGWSFTSPVLPSVSTISAIPGTVTALLTGSVTAMGAYSTLYAGFLYGTDPLFGTYSTSTPLSTITGAGGHYTFNATGLTNGLTYYYEAFVGDGLSILAYGISASFLTGAPSVATIAASNPTQTSAQINGNILTLGTYTTVTVQFQWGLTTSYGQLTTPDTKIATGAFSYNLDSTNGIILNGGVTYHYQAILSYTGPGSPVYGTDMTFDTLALDKPIAPSAPGSITLGQGQTYQKMLGPTLSGALDTCGKAVGTDGRGFGGGLTFIVCVIILIFCSARGYPVAGLALGYPLQLVSAWVGLWDWAFVGVVTFILALIWVKATWLDK